MNEVKLFKNKELGLQARTILNEDGSISVNAEDTAIGFGWYKTEIKNGKEYLSIRWATLNSYCKELGFDNELAKEDYIPESLFYMLGMKANNERAIAYQKWIAMELLPTLRKTGSYEMPKTEPQVPFKEIIEVIPFIAEDLKVNSISRLIMYKDLCKDYNVPTNFLPSYINNGDREKKSATELLKQFQCGISAKKFNELMVTAGYLEERGRKSVSSKTGIRKYKVLTEKGKRYGEN